MKTSEYTEINRRMWNETATVHEAATMAGLLAQVGVPDFSTFDEVERRLFARIGLPGKAVAQLACNNGRELISVKKAGAGLCVGFDISEDFIDQARRLSAAAGVDVEWQRTDLYAIGAEFDARFDLVFLTVGVVGWMPDLARLFALARRLLRTGGQLFIYEMHPILNLFEVGGGLTLQHGYFREEPFQCSAEPDYMDSSQVIHSRSYWFHHKLSDLIQGVLNEGLRLEHFEEHAHDVSMIHAALATEANRPPMSYSLIARKEPD